MAYYASWLVPDRIAYLKMNCAVDDVQIGDFDHELCDVMDAGADDAARVHFIIWHNAVDSDLNIMTLLLSLKASRHPRKGWTVIICTPNPIIRVVGSVVSQIAKMNVRPVDSVEGGLAFLYYMDTTLSAALPLSDALANIPKECVPLDCAPENAPSVVKIDCQPGG